MRDQQIYYVQCPEVPYHFILQEPEIEKGKKAQPKGSPLVACKGCGERHIVNVTQPWKIGYVSHNERDQLMAYSEPQGEPDPLPSE